MITVHVGGIFLWVSIFLFAYQGPLQSVVYAFWTLSFILIVTELWRILRAGLTRLELDDYAALSHNPSVS